MKRYLVDFVFLPDRTEGVQVAVEASNAAASVEIATRQLAREIPTTWAYELTRVTEA